MIPMAEGRHPHPESAHLQRVRSILQDIQVEALVTAQFDQYRAELHTDARMFGIDLEDGQLAEVWALAGKWGVRLLLDMGLSADQAGQWVQALWRVGLSDPSLP
jgi:hypothetical protein